MNNYQLDSVDFLPVLEKKQELMEKITGEFSEFINSKKLNNLLCVTPMKVGTNLIKWLRLLKTFIRV